MRCGAGRPAAAPRASVLSHGQGCGGAGICGDRPPCGTSPRLREQPPAGLTGCKTWGVSGRVLACWLVFGRGRVAKDRKVDGEDSVRSSLVLCIPRRACPCEACL